MLEVIAGWDNREGDGFAVAMSSLLRQVSAPVRVTPLQAEHLRTAGIYWRKEERRGDQLWDLISDAPMATTFANARFLTPWLSRENWALFCDFADMLFVGDLARLFALADPAYAVMVVKREEYIPPDELKMDDQIQTRYRRKNWSSLVLWNLRHEANLRLTLRMVNELPGRDLHRFCWLEDDEIGALPREWNVLVGVDEILHPKVLHFTSGIPTMKGHAFAPYANLWFSEYAKLLKPREDDVPVARQA